MLQEYIKYLKDNPEGYWFKRKLYGWGWTPATREGWLVITIYIAVMFYLAIGVREMTSDQEVYDNFLLPVGALTLLLLLIAYKKGEKPGWQWGKKK